MTIIIEGVDRCGKSTQVNKLHDYFLNKGIPVTIGHAQKIPGKNLLEVEHKSHGYYSKLIGNIECIDEVKIWDRAHLGEAVYSPKYRGYNGDYVFDAELTHLQFDSENAFKDVYLFFFYDNVENLIKRDDGNSFSTKKDDMQEEIDLFLKAFNKSHIPHKYAVNISDIGNENAVFEFILKKIGC